MPFKYQEQFSADLTTSWLEGNHSHVRTVIRGLKNKAQAAYIAASVAYNLGDDACDFIAFIHPNNK